MKTFTKTIILSLLLVGCKPTFKQCRDFFSNEAEVRCSDLADPNDSKAELECRWQYILAKCSEYE